jgi:hypothetical protein
MKVKLNAATRLAASTKVQSGYEGTKISDLNQYVRTMNPKIRPVRMTGPGQAKGGGPIQSAGVLQAWRVPATEARALAQSLVADGWRGRKAARKVMKTGEQGEKKIVLIEYMVYLPLKDLPNPASITMSKPDRDNFVRVTLTQSTAQSRTSNWNTRRLNAPYKFGRSRY